MGHLVNPVAWRLGKNIYWRSLYYINSLDFATSNVGDVNLFIFLNKFFKNKFFKFSNLSISNFKILKSFAGTTVYALFKSYNYRNKGLFKYSRRIPLDKFFRKRLLKKKAPLFFKKKKRKKSFLKKVKRSAPKSKKLDLFGFFLKRRPKIKIVGLSSFRAEAFRKIVSKKIRFILKGCNFYKLRYLKKGRFLNYYSYINNFRKNFGHVHRRQIEHNIVARIMMKLKRIFLLKFSKKNIGKNFIFKNYFFVDPANYFRKKSYFIGRKKILARYSLQDKDNLFVYSFKKFFIFNILKSFPNFFGNLYNKYTSCAKKYIFIRNKLKFRLSFYNNFLYIYRKFPFFLFVKNFLSSFVNKFFDKVKFVFIFCSEKFISANLVKDFILNKMSHRFKLSRISFSVVRLLNDYFKRGVIKGFRILLAGRFTRKDRATFYWKKGGFLSFNNRMSALDYSLGTKVLRYSLCVCKVWINS